MRIRIQSNRDTLEINLCTRRAVKAEFQNYCEKHTDPCVSGLCIGILHFV